MSIRSILIVGGGVTAWSAAAALAKQLPHIKIDVLETQVVDEATAESAVTSLREFHRLLNINEREIALATDATFKLATRFCDWLRPGQDYWLGLGETGHSLDGIEFQQYASLLHQCGDSTTYEAYSLGAQAARQYKFNPLSAEQHTRGFQLPYALQMETGSYTTMLRDFAQALGVNYQRGDSAGLELDSTSGNISVLHTKTGGRVSADFYIDCTGASACLSSQLTGDRYMQSDAHKLLGDRRLDWTTPAQAPGCLDLKAQAAGWRKSISLHSRTHQQYFYSSEFANEDRTLAKITTLYPEADIKTVQLRPGVRKQPWIKNCLALGSAAGDCGSLVLSPLHLVHSGILRWLELLPTAHFSSFADEYNRLTFLEYERAMDFHWLPFALSQRNDSSYWRACKTAAVSEPLAHRMALFRQCGKMASYDQESFSPALWTSLFLANHYWPQKYDARLHGVNIAQVQRYTSQLKFHIQQMIAAMPSQDDYLSAYHSHR